MAKAIKLAPGETVYALYDEGDKQFVYVVDWTDVRHTAVPKASGMGVTQAELEKKIETFERAMDKYLVELKASVKEAKEEAKTAKKNDYYSTWEPSYYLDIAKQVRKDKKLLRSCKIAKLSMELI